MIVRQGMAIAMIGTAAGLCGSLLLRNFIPAAGATSIWAIAGTAMLMLGVSLFACAVPAVRVLRLNPVAVLRED